MKLTDPQRNRAERVREILNVQTFTDPFPPFDLTDALGMILEGTETLVEPDEMGQRFNAAWKAYAAIWGMEHNTACQQAVGDDELWDRVKQHPNGREVVAAILSRIHAVQGAIVPGMEVEVDVGDILVDHQIEPVE